MQQIYDGSIGGITTLRLFDALSPIPKFKHSLSLSPLTSLGRPVAGKQKAISTVRPTDKRRADSTVKGGYRMKKYNATSRLKN
jgi:hypothetical protein